ncbi:MAG: hypothetical protein FD146_1904 [Anaerolineaceae bacterium]|nr:MAG: hypothetical protein FD146_1904 [Anaerolineaceae bacterium]
MEMFGLVLLILFGGVAFIALLAAVHLLLPGAVDKARQKLEVALGKSFLLGLVDLLFFGALVVVLFWLGQMIGGVVAGIFAFLGLLLLLALGVFALNGLAALASLLGERIGEAKSPFRRDLRGGLLLSLAGLTPYIGWYLFTPVVLCMALGASILALFQRKTA